VLKLLRAFVNEDNYIVWTAVTKIIGTLHSLLQYSNNDELVKAFTNFGKLILCFISDNVGWEPKPGEGISDICLLFLGAELSLFGF